MKVEVASSFFESLKRMGSLGSKFRSICFWFRYHFNKDFFKLFKTLLKSYPWDEGFLYDLEKAKIEEMRKYHERVQRFEGVEYTIRDMKICESLIDIFTGKRDLFHYDGDIKFIKNEDGHYELKKTDDFKYHCDVYANTKNMNRFVHDEKLYDFYINHPDELYQLKAKYLYHKIRYDNDGSWWD